MGPVAVHGLELDTPIGLRPGVLIHSADPVDSVIIDESRTMTFVGSVYASVLALLVTPTTVRRLLAQFRTQRDRALAHFCLQVLIRHRVVIGANRLRGPFLYSDYFVGRLPTAQETSFWVTACGAAALACAPRLARSIAQLGFAVDEQVSESSARVTALLVSARAGFDELASSQKNAFVVVLLGLDRTVVGPFLKDPTREWRRARGRVAAILDDTSRLHRAEDLAEPLLHTALYWAAREIVRGGSATTNARLRCRSLAYETLATREHLLLGLEPEASDHFEGDWRKAPSEVSEGLRTEGDSVMLTKAAVVVDRVTGIVPFLQQVGSGPITVFVTLHSRGDHQRARIAPHEGRIAASGKGYSSVAAELSCIGEAIERFSASYCDEGGIRRARARDLNAPFLDPRVLLNFSERQYALRDRSEDQDRRAAGFNWVPPRYQETEEIGWIVGREVLTSRSVYVPAALTLFNYHRRGEHHYGIADSNGCASGNTHAEALLHGLLELIERDACGIWWYNMLQKPRIDLIDCPDPRIRAALEWAESHDRAVHVLDLTTELGVPVCAAVSHNSTGRLIHIGLGASLGMRAAVRRALAEMRQVGVLDLEAMPVQPSDPVQRDLLDWYREASMSRCKWLMPQRSHVVSWDEAQCDVVSGLERVLGTLTDHGLPSYAVNLSRRDLPLRVVRAVVPGLRHFWRRLGPGRLFDVPVTAGWLAASRTEEEMNPTSFSL